MDKQSGVTDFPIRSEPTEKGLRIVAFFEGAKGAIVLLTGFGFFLLVHKDLHRAAADLVRQLHFNPASKYPHIFLDLADQTNDANLWAMACAAVIYAAARFAEAVGLWLNRRWAEWFGLLTGAMYIPVELFELAQGVTWPKTTVFTINVIVVLYLLFVLLERRKNRKRPSHTLQKTIS